MFLLGEKRNDKTKKRENMACRCLKRGKKFSKNNKEIDNSALAKDLGYRLNDYAKTKGLDQDPDWEESFDFDDLGEG